MTYTRNPRLRTSGMMSSLHDLRILVTLRDLPTVEDIPGQPVTLYWVRPSEDIGDFCPLLGTDVDTRSEVKVTNRRCCLSITDRFYFR